MTVFGPSDTSRASAIVATVLSTALLALTTYMKDTDLGQLAERHKETASKLWRIRESYLSILTDLKGGLIDLAHARDLRDELQSELADIYRAAPRTLPAAYAKAGLALKESEELTFSESEIDRFLPAALRMPGGS
jgi:hypothetical protein